MLVVGPNGPTVSKSHRGSDEKSCAAERIADSGDPEDHAGSAGLHPPASRDVVRILCRYFCSSQRSHVKVPFRTVVVSAPADIARAALPRAGRDLISPRLAGSESTSRRAARSLRPPARRKPPAEASSPRWHPPCPRGRRPIERKLGGRLDDVVWLLCRSLPERELACHHACAEDLPPTRNSITTSLAPGTRRQRSQSAIRSQRAL